MRRIPNHLIVRALALACSSPFPAHALLADDCLGETWQARVGPWHVCLDSYRVDGYDNEDTLRVVRPGAPEFALRDVRIDVGRRDPKHRLPVGRDMTGDGVPDLLARTFSGGASCCTGVVVVELGKVAREIARFDLGRGALDQVTDRTGDGLPDIVIYKGVDTAACCTAQRPDRHLVLTWRGGRFCTVPPEPGFWLVSAAIELVLRVAERRDMGAACAVANAAVDAYDAGMPDIVGILMRDVDGHTGLEPVEWLVRLARDMADGIPGPCDPHVPKR